MSNLNEVKKVAKFSISTWVNFVLGFFSTFILTRIFLPEVLGTINLFYSTISTLLSVVCLGLDSGFIRFFNEPPQKETSALFLFKLIVLCILNTIILSIISYLFFADDITDFFLGTREFSLYVCLVLGVINQIFLRFLNISYRMRMDIRNYTIQSVLTNVVTRLSVITGALLDSTSALYAILGNVFCMSLLLCFYLFYQRKEWIPKKVDFLYSHYKEIISFSLHLALAAVIINMYSLSSQLVVKNMLGVYEAGVYASSSLFIAIMAVVKGGFGSYWSAFMYANYKKPEKKAFIMQTHRILLLISIVFLCILFPLRRVLYLFIGHEYWDSMSFFSLVLLYPLLQTVQETTGYGILIKKKPYITTLISFVSVASNIGLGIILIPICGLIGMAWANFVAAIITFASTSIIGQIYYRSVPNYYECVIGIFLLLSITVLTVFIENDIYLSFVAAIVLTCASFLYRDVLKHCLIFLKEKIL